jgi:uncharacterized phage-associated protein
MPHSSLAIANEFIRRAQAAGTTLTHMQLQKLVYLAHGWNLAVNNTQLVEDGVEAWEYGTVFRRLYDALKRYGRHPVTEFIRWGDDTPFRSDDGKIALAELTPQESAVVDRVWKTYGKYPAFQLSAVTHIPGGPWAKFHSHGQNTVIPNGEIKSHFTTLASGAVGK